VASSIPGEELQWGRSFSRSDHPETSIRCYIIAIDENFFQLFDAKFVAGKNYPDGSSVWKDAIIINEAAAKQFGYLDAPRAIGKTILWREGDKPLAKEVIGVIADFNQQSLHNKIEPIVFTLKDYVFAPWAGEFYAFKVQAPDLKHLSKRYKNCGAIRSNRIHSTIFSLMIILMPSIGTMNSSAKSSLLFQYWPYLLLVSDFSA
jgi:putative ABC transport system permease protein